MAHSKQARKRILQNERNRVANKTKMSAVKTVFKAVMAAVAAGDKQKASALAQRAFQSIDKAVKSEVIHQNQAARHKSQIARAVGAMG